MVFADNCTVRLKQTLTVTLRCGGRVAGAPVCKTYVRKWRVQAISACGYFVDERTGHSGQLPEGRQGRGQAVQPGPLHRPPPRPGVQAGGTRSAVRGQKGARPLPGRPGGGGTHRQCVDAARCVLQLFHHMGRIFREQSSADAVQTGLHIDRKRRRQLLKKRLALGHKADDHEDAPQMGWK